MEHFALVRSLLQMQEQLLSKDVSLTEQFADVCNAAVALSRADGGVLEMHDSASDEMIYTHATGSFAPFVGLRLGRAGSLSGLTMDTRSVLVSEDTELDPRVNKEACRRVGARSMVILPLQNEGVFVGVLKVASARPSAFSQHTIEILRLVCGFLGAALARAAAADERTLLLRYRDEMAALVIHDLKSPLTALVANIEFMRSELPSTQVEALEAASDALSAATRLDVMIGTLLETARLEEARLPVTLTEVSLREVVTRVFDERARDALNRGIAVDVEIDASLVVDADASLLRRVVENLVDNAIKHGRSGGRIVTRARNVLDAVEISVADTGIAIRSEDRVRIFEKYTQLEGARRYGLGMGLHFCRLAARAHGGDIRLESNDEFANVFVVSFPDTRASS